MDIIKVVRGFGWAEGIHPEEIAPGEYSVGKHQPSSGVLSAECCVVALQEGWAEQSASSPPEDSGPEGSSPLPDPGDDTGRQSPDSGQAEQSASSPPDQVSAKKKSGKSKAKQK